MLQVEIDSLVDYGCDELARHQAEALPSGCQLCFSFCQSVQQKGLKECPGLQHMLRTHAWQVPGKPQAGLRGGCAAQTDKKTLNTKMMMQEMKEVREQRRAADTAVKAVSVKTPFVFPLSPDLTFNCQDGWAPALPASLMLHELDHSLTAMLSCDPVGLTVQ